MSDYIPISCSVYDELEILAMRSRVVELKLKDGRIFHGKIVQLEARKSVEYLKLDNYQEFRLDHIHSLVDRENLKEYLIHANNC
ncbi:MAG TPA: Rho-binding antiterminator [Flavobacteriales bacterium]|jgi:transcriptional antiterminator Rof (Rho-off)|nr:Rho-binding antiterminator [Flavobacteriales bacterium]